MLKARTRLAPAGRMSTLSRVSQYDPYAPRDVEPGYQYSPVRRGSSLRELIRRLFAPIIGLGLLVLKFGAFSIKFFGIFISIGGYALIWGWKFGVGFVAMILIHELGHFFEGKRQGLEVSIPRFIPFLGAYVLIKNSPLNPLQNAKLALAGPAAGGLASLACWGLASANGSSLLHALAYAGFFLNLINLLPIGILDGGAIWRAYRLAKAEPMVPLAADGVAVMLPGAGRGRATLILTMYLGLAALLALGMWGTHVPQNRL
jgi:Zn-dependent protease